jgi:hypothetical protein
MRRSTRHGATFVVALLALASGCGAGSKPVPPSCLSGPQDIERALLSAPGPVALGDGTRLSQCVARATSDSDLQNVGLVFTQAADHLALRISDHDTAVRLGYLIGATRRGALHTAGVATELARRVEQDAHVDAAAPDTNSALHRGLTAGENAG